MAIHDLPELSGQAPPRTPLVGLDLGEKTIGVAVSDATRMIASPLETIRKTKFTDDVAALFRLMESRGPTGISCACATCRSPSGTSGCRRWR